MSKKSRKIAKNARNFKENGKILIYNVIVRIKFYPKMLVEDEVAKWNH